MSIKSILPVDLYRKDESNLEERRQMNNGEWTSNTIEDLLECFEKYPFLIGALREVEGKYGYLAVKQLMDSIIMLLGWSDSNSFKKGKMFMPGEWLTPFRKNDDNSESGHIITGLEGSDSKTCKGTLASLVL